MAQAQQWEPISSLPNLEFTSIKLLENKLYATSNNNLYISSDGTNWLSENITNKSITPTTIELFNNVLYIGTAQNGVYYRNIHPGSTWKNDLSGMHINHFIIHAERLHFCSLGLGVWQLIDNKWNNITYNLPSYSNNVNKIVSINGDLYAFAGGNGTFYIFDKVNNIWIENYYSNTYQPGLIIDDVLLINNTILAANGRRLIRSNDNSENWSSDNLGLINGVNRILYKGINSIYSLTLNPSTNFTYLQKRNIIAPAETDWGNFNEVLEFYSYAIQEFQGKIYIASNLGMFVKSDSNVDEENPIKNKTNIIVYPTPSSDGNINIKSNVKIDKITIYDLNGREIQSRSINNFECVFHISSSGIYLFKIIANGDLITKKVIIN